MEVKNERERFRNSTSWFTWNCHNSFVYFELRNTIKDK